MKLNKILVTMCLTAILILSIFSNTYAATGKSGTLTLSLDSSSSYKVGGTVVINVDLSLSGFDGVREFLADVEYDAKILKYTGAKGLNSWSIINSEGNIYIENKTNSSGRLCQLTFEVLDASPNTTVQLTNTDASGKNGSVLALLDTLNEPSISFKTEALPTTPDAPDTPGTPDTPDTPGTPADPTPDTPADPTPDAPTDPTPDTPATKPSSKPASTSKPTSTKTNKPTTAPGKIPQTGTMELGMILIAIGVDISIVMLIKYRKANRRIDR